MPINGYKTMSYIPDFLGIIVNKLFEKLKLILDLLFHCLKYIYIYICRKLARSRLPSCTKYDCNVVPLVAKLDRHILYGVEMPMSVRGVDLGVLPV